MTVGLVCMSIMSVVLLFESIDHPGMRDYSFYIYQGSRPLTRLGSNISAEICMVSRMWDEQGRSPLMRVPR